MDWHALGGYRTPHQNCSTGPQMNTALARLGIAQCAQWAMRSAHNKQEQERMQEPRRRSPALHTRATLHCNSEESFSRRICNHCDVHAMPSTALVQRCACGHCSPICGRQGGVSRDGCVMDEASPYDTVTRVCDKWSRACVTGSDALQIEGALACHRRHGGWLRVVMWDAILRCTSGGWGG